MIRYPGSKAKFTEQILALAMPDSLSLGLWKTGHVGAYCEPFMGAGAMTRKIIENLPQKTPIVLNDKDLWMACLWNSVLDSPNELCAKIDSFKPTAAAFYEFKSQDGSVIDPLEAGFRKLALHQISYSGLGAMAGGPLGGKESSNSQYPPGCRWRPARLKKEVAEWHKLLKRFKKLTIHCKDFEGVLRGLHAIDFAYLDPPYFEKGGQLYKHNMDEKDHVRLSAILKTSNFRWALSYDDHPRIRELYSWATIREIEITYTIATAGAATRPKNHEIIITKDL